LATLPVISVAAVAGKSAALLKAMTSASA